MFSMGIRLKARKSSRSRSKPSAPWFHFLASRAYFAPIAKGRPVAGNCAKRRLRVNSWLGTEATSDALRVRLNLNPKKNQLNQEAECGGLGNEGTPRLPQGSLLHPQGLRYLPKVR